MDKEKLKDCAYEVRVHPSVRIITAIVFAIVFLFDILFTWAIIKNWEVHPRTFGEVFLVAIVFHFPVLLTAFLVEYYIYRVRLFVVDREREYSYRPFFGHIRNFTINDISQVEMGGSYSVTLWRGHVISIYGAEHNLLCRLNLRMTNAVLFAEELQRALKGKHFVNHYTEEIISQVWSQPYIGRRINVRRLPDELIKDLRKMARDVNESD